MAGMGPLPAWIPAQELFLWLVALIGFTLLMNRGRWWFINVLAIDEPLVVSVGILIAALSGKLADSPLGFLSADAWLVIGVLLALLGVAVWYSDELDISNLI